tara:strand:- start:1816 stop:3324 length:1509 start_codon:yes stop_codon:yes gene_type:complete
MGIAEKHKLHPSNDLRLSQRHAQFTSNPANDPDFIYDLMDRCDREPEVERAVHDSFFDGDLTFLFHDAQIQIYNCLQSPKNLFLVLCSRQLGKSFAILAMAIMHCCKPYGRRKPLVRIFCQTQKQINEITHDNMGLIEALSPPGFIQRTKSENRYKVGFGEIRLGMVSAAHVNGKRGGNATLVIIEEGGFTPSEDLKNAVQSVIGPQLLRSEGKLIHVTTSSEDDQHYIHTDIQPKCDLDGTLINLTIYDNPQLRDKQIINAWDLLGDVTGEKWSREYLCLVVRSMTLTVCPEFHDSSIYDFEPPKYLTWLTAIDFGGVRDKHGILICYWNFDLACFDVLDECLLPINTPTSLIRSTTLDLEKKWGLDPSQVRRISDNPGQISVDLGVLGFYVTMPDKPAGSWEANISAIRIALTQKKLRVHRRCKMLAATLRYGKFNKKRTDFLRTEELGHLDLLATLMYGWRHKDESNPYPRLPENYSKDTHYRAPAAVSPLALILGKDR